MAPYDFKRGQTIKTNAEGVSVDRSFLAHWKAAAAAAVAADADGVHTLAVLGSAAQYVTTGITNPAVPRNPTITGNVSGITGTVTVSGTNYNGEDISEELAANGAATVAGNKAFKTIKQIDLPARTHTPAYQTETKQVTHAASAAGTITLTLTAAGYAGDPIALEVELDDTAAEVAAKIADALNDQDEFAALFTASVTSAGNDTVLLTAKAYAANDSTLSLAFADTDTTGVTMGASTNGTAGVAEDKISIGWGDKFGIPYLLEADEQVIIKLFNKSADTGTVTNSATDIELNTFDPNGSPDGLKDIDLYIIV